MSITIDGIVKYFNSVKVLNNVRLSIETGEMIALLGPSGSGKTTLLRVIAGLDYHDSGSILFNNKDVSNLQPGARKVGFVFQSYALFKHMTVASNVAFGLKALPRRKRPGISLIRKKVYNLLDRVQLCHLADRYPAQLSGGQKQRVALARALAVEPEILLLDEPFGALDSKVRIELRRWLRELHKELRFTGVFVTHDQEEAMEVADRIVVMNNGIIEQVGTPKDVWCFPSNRFVLEFLGEINCIEGEIRDSRLFLDNYCWPFLYIPYYQGKVEIFLRPWDILLSEQFSELYSIPVQIIDVGLRGYYWQLGVKIVDWDSRKHLISVMVNFVDVYNIPKRGSYCYLRAKNIKIYYFDSNTILL